MFNIVIKKIQIKSTVTSLYQPKSLKVIYTCIKFRKNNLEQLKCSYVVSQKERLQLVGKTMWCV